MLKKLLITTALLSTSALASVSITPVPHDANCLALAYCRITGHHDIEIINESETVRTYHINAGLNSGDGNVDVYERKNIVLNPHEKYNDHHEYALYEKYNNAGGYKNSVFVGIYGDEGLTKNAYGHVVVYPRVSK